MLEHATTYATTSFASYSTVFTKPHFQLSHKCFNHQHKYATREILLTLRSQHEILQTRGFSSSQNVTGNTRSRDEVNSQAEGVRISSLLSKHLGMSRRQSERMVMSERVTLFGKAATTPSFLLYPSNNNIAIKVDGRLLRGVEKTLKELSLEQVKDALKNESSNISSKDLKNGSAKQNDAINREFSSTTRVWLANKLKGELITENDPDGRPSMLQRLIRGGVGVSSKKNQNIPTHLKPVGRLDMMTEGLMIFTNDGKYAREFELPVNQLWRTYRVRVHGRLTPGKLQAMRKGLTVRMNDDVNNAANGDKDVTIVQPKSGTMMKYKGIKVSIERKSASKISAQRRGPRGRESAGGGGTNTWLQITCTEGKNRQLRRILGALGLDVTRLVRISYGDYDLNTIPPGRAIEVPCKNLGAMKKRGSLFVADGGRKDETKTKHSSEKVDGKDVQTSSVEWVTYS